MLIRCSLIAKTSNGTESLRRGNETLARHDAADRAMAKLGARDRAQLVVLAYETGLVAPRLRRPG